MKLKLESWLKEHAAKIARSKHCTKVCRRMEESSHGLDLRPYREPLSNEWKEGLAKARAQVSEIGAKHRTTKTRKSPKTTTSVGCSD